MSKVTDFEWLFDSPVVKWKTNGTPVVLQYGAPIRSAVLLDDQSGVAVVEPFAERGRNNAVVFNADGTERFRLRFPLPEPYGNCFDQMYYVRGVLTAFANLQGADFGCELDQETGSVKRSFEAR